MNIFKGARNLRNRLIEIQLPVMVRILVAGMILSSAMIACDSKQSPNPWQDENTLTISQYLSQHQDEYPKAYRLLVQAKLLTTLYAYNPYGDNYTLFLPSDGAIDRLIEQNEQYQDFEELAKDTTYIKMLMRYHIINGSYYTDEFPDGAFIDTTLSGHRLVASFFANNNEPLIKINNTAPIIKPNLKMTNGYIHVISDVLQPMVTSGYTWLQQQNDYSILAKAMLLSEVRKRLYWSKYTILAEPDSIYHRYGINSVEDLISHMATPDKALNDVENTFYKFTAYHILNKDYYMNDWSWGIRDYQTLNGNPITIDIGQDIKFNIGVDWYVLSKSVSGETATIDYIRPIAERYNILTRTGPVHPITDLLYNQPLPNELQKVY